MNYLKIIEKTIEILNLNKEYEKAEKLASLRDGAATGGELLSSCTSTLLKYIKNDGRLSSLIGKEANELKIICEANGINVF